MPTDAANPSGNKSSGRFEEVYDIKEEVGRGQFAVVHRVVRRRDGAEFAAKVMRKRSKNALDLSGVNKSAFDLEVRILHLLEHPNVIKLEEAYDEKHCFILVFELLKGGELFSKMLSRGRFSEAESVVYLREILCALKHLHSLNVVHLDIKPENVMLSGSDDESSLLKIIDFGLSRILSSKYTTRDMVGTPEFVAPEVLNYDDITLSTDMWSVGVLTYILMTGYSPFLGRSQQETYERVNEARCQLDGPHFTGISHVAKDFVRRLIRRSPSERSTVDQCLGHAWLTFPIPETPLTVTGTQSGYEVAQQLEIADPVSRESSGTSSPALTDRASLTSGASSSMTASSNTLDKPGAMPIPQVASHSAASSSAASSSLTTPVSEIAQVAAQLRSPRTSVTKVPPNTPQQQTEASDSGPESLQAAISQLSRPPRSHHHHHHHKRHHKPVEHEEEAEEQVDEQVDEEGVVSVQAVRRGLRPTREPLVLLRPIPEQQSLLISARGNLRSSNKSDGGLQRNVSHRRAALADQLKKLKPHNQPRESKSDHGKHMTSSGMTGNEPAKTSSKHPPKTTTRALTLKPQNTLKPSEDSEATTPVAAETVKQQSKPEKSSKQQQQQLGGNVKHKPPLAPHSDKSKPIDKSNGSEKSKLPVGAENVKTSSGVEKQIEASESSRRRMTLEPGEQAPPSKRCNSPSYAPPSQQLSHLHLVPRAQSNELASSTGTLTGSSQRLSPQQAAGSAAGTGESSALRLLRKLSGKNRHKQMRQHASAEHVGPPFGGDSSGIETVDDMKQRLLTPPPLSPAARDYLKQKSGEALMRDDDEFESSSVTEMETFASASDLRHRDSTERSQPPLPQQSQPQQQIQHQQLHDHPQNANSSIFRWLIGKVITK